jgi:hypothetical protein
MARVSKITVVLSISLVLLALGNVIARAQNLPSTQQFNSALTTCATNSDISISADLLGSVSSVYDGQKTQGTANLKTATKFIELFPEQDRAKIYELYTRCISQILHLGSVSPPHYAVEFKDGILRTHNIGGEALDANIDVEPRLDLYANTCASQNGLYEVGQSFYISFMSEHYSQDEAELELDPRLILRPFIDGPGSEQLGDLKSGLACFIADRQELAFGIEAYFKDASGKPFEDCFFAHIFRNGSRIYAEGIERRACKGLMAEVNLWKDLPPISLPPNSPVSPRVLAPLWAEANQFGSQPHHLAVCVTGCDR